MMKIREFIQSVDISVLIHWSFKIAIIIGVILAVGYTIKVGLYIYQDNRLKKNAVLLKVLPKKGTEIKELENLIKNIHSMLLNTKLRKLRYGRPYMSFEIAAKQGRINFYIWVPGDMKSRLVDRIYAAYPEVAIETVEDYVPSNKNLYSEVAELRLAYNHTLKVKTRQEIMGSILAAMKDLDKKDFVGLQIVVRPVDNKWQIEGRKELAKFEQEGIRPGEKRRTKDKVLNAMNSALVEMDEVFAEQGLRLNLSGHNLMPRKTKLDRKEITVASEKLLDVGYETVIRVIALGKYKKANTGRVRAIVAAFSELNAENKFKREFIASKKYIVDLFKKRKPCLLENNNILTPPELSSFFLMLPGSELINKYSEVERLSIKEFDIPKEAEATGKGIVFAENVYRATKKLVEIKDKDVVRHIVLQGKTGTGKSEFMKTAFLNQISNSYDENGKLLRKGKGAMVLEPHGKLANELLEIIPEDRRKDVVLFDLYSDHPWPLNFCKVPDRESDILSKDQLAQKTLDEAIEIFKRTFSDVWSEKNEFYITNALRAIMDTGHTMVELPRMFSDKKFRNSVIPNIKDPKVKNFWKNKFKENAQGKIDASVESTAQSVEYKLEKFLKSQELIRALGQNDCIDFKEILDTNKIIIFKFSKDKMSRDSINFLGGIAMKLLIVGAFARDKAMWNDPFIVWIDEAQNFINESIKDVLYELRKYGVGLFLMHQELEQMKEVPGLINAIYNNVGTSITFTTGDLDAPFFAKKYGPRIDEDDLNNLPSRYGYCKLLVNGQASDVFNIYSMDSPHVSEEVAKKSVNEILEYNRKGKMSVEEIDEMISARYEDEEVVDVIDKNKTFSIDVKEEEEKINENFKIKKNEEIDKKEDEEKYDFNPKHKKSYWD